MLNNLNFFSVPTGTQLIDSSVLQNYSGEVNRCQQRRRWDEWR